jgi:DNA-binding NtrC family response regulator
MTTTQAPASRVNAASIIVIDDEENMCKILGKILTMENYRVRCFTDPREAVEQIRRSPPDIVVTDLRMPEMTGMEVLQATRAASPNTNVLVLTAYATIETAIDAMRAGAFDYITKPFKTDELLLTIGKALEHTRLLAENESLNETLRRQVATERIIGDSAQMHEVLSTIAKVAPTDAAVLIRGESGTGKELVAKAIHQSSSRHRKRFVAINCASIPESLLESELFGHEKGSFTGADRTKLGMFELAHEGTLFLDEIGELPMALQPKLLRALQEQEIQRVGGMQPIPVNVRLLAATNRDLKAAIEKREFRSDLFYRLNVINVTLPTLRDRPADIPVLVNHILERTRKKIGKPGVTMSPEALEMLMKYDYPGNVRELENIIERVVVLSDGGEIQPMDLPTDVREGASGLSPGESRRAAANARAVEYKDAKDDFEREYLMRVINAAKGNISEAARISGISRRHFYEKLERLHIKTER